jgi:hypothetical protein
MKHIKLLLILIILVILFAVGCNSEIGGTGIFKQISDSKPNVEVGAVTLLQTDGNVFHALTFEKGLQVYNATTNAWLSNPIRPENDSNPIVNASYSNIDNSVYFITSALTGQTNKLYAYDTVSKLVSLESQDYQIIHMDPALGLMMAKKDNLLKVHAVDDLSAKFTITGFSEFPWMIAQNTTTILVTGRDATTPANYKHVLYNSGAPTEITNIDSAIVAFYFDGTNYIVVTEDKKVWKGTDPAALESDQTLSYSIPIPGKPIPTFIANNKLYLQGTSSFYAIAMDGTVETLDDGFAASLKATSFVITSYLVDGSTVYGGSAKNGIFKISGIDNTATATVSWYK